MIAAELNTLWVAAPLVLTGALRALFLLLASLVLSTILAVPLTLASVYGPRFVARIIAVYSWIARGTPPLIILFMAFYGFARFGIRLSPMTSAVVAFVGFATAYNFEILRAALLGVPAGQIEAARALGVPFHKILARIVLPQLITIATPSYFSHATILLKETSLASVVAVLEIMGATNSLVSSIGHPFTLIVLAGVLYAILNSGLLLLESAAERQWPRR